MQLTLDELFLGQEELCFHVHHSEEDDVDRSPNMSRPHGGRDRHVHTVQAPFGV